jgi:hypothetical protein
LNKQNGFTQSGTASSTSVGRNQIDRLCHRLQGERALVGAYDLAESGQIVSLLDMLQFYAHRFMTVLELLGTLERMPVHNGKPAVANLSDPGVVVIQRLCDDLIEQLRGMGLKLSCKSIEHIKKQVVESKWVNPTMSPEIAEARRRIHDELEDVFLFSINRNYEEFWNQKSSLFGADVDSKFPEVSEDISESAKCIAVGRYTAAVFHLMRATEALVQHFGSVLGVTLTFNKNWQNILDETAKSLKALPQKDAKTIKLYGVNAHLHSVKMAWRNEVMHPKATYTEEEALNVYNNVKTFARDLATIL